MTAARCAARGCQGKPHTKGLCVMHYKRWHRGERIDLDAGSMRRDPAARVLANVAENARRTELYTARLEGCPLERALAAGLGLRERNVL